MPQDLRQTVQREYDALQRDEQRERDARVEEAERLDPQIRSLLEKRAMAFTREYSAALSAGRQPDKERARREYAQVTADIQKRLSALGLPQDQLDIRYRCPICRDRGYVGDVDRRDCDCFKRRIEAERIRRAKLAMAGVDTFETFDEQVFSDEKLPGRSYSQRSFMARVRAMCQDYCESFPQNARRNMLLMGASGLGKTFLLNCIANRLSDRGRQVCYLTAYRMFDAMRQCALGDDTEAFSTMVDSEALMIDDLGSEPLYRNITIEMLFTLLNERMRMHKHTLIATNMSLSELLQRYGERVMSRLADGNATLVLNFEGRDLRMKSSATPSS